MSFTVEVRTKSSTKLESSTPKIPLNKLIQVRIASKYKKYIYNYDRYFFSIIILYIIIYFPCLLIFLTHANFMKDVI